MVKKSGIVDKVIDTLANNPQLATLIGGALGNSNEISNISNNIVPALKNQVAVGETVGGTLKGAVDTFNSLNDYKYLIILFIISWSVGLLVLYNMQNSEKEKEDIKYTNSVIVNTLIICLTVILLANIVILFNPILAVIKESIPGVVSTLLK